MSDTWFKVKIWTKLILLGLLILFILLFIWENHSSTASVWFFGAHQMTVLELLAGTFLFGVLVTLLAKPTLRTLRQISELTKKTPPPAPTPVPPPTPIIKP